MKIIVFLLTALLSPAIFALPQQALVPGGIALVRLPDYKKNTTVFFHHKRVAVFPYKHNWYALAGISLTTRPGNYELSIHHHDGQIFDTKIDIKPKKYAQQHLTISNKHEVDPDKQDLIRIYAERKRKNKARRLYTDNQPEVNFIWPVHGYISSIFGLRRFFNGQERRPHNGLDIAAAEGTPIRATADGTVIDAGNFFFSGNMIYLNHGEGIISLYAHLSKIDVKPGERVKQGQIIGLVGHTGRATGPHLHFAVFANQTLIDPMFMLPKGGNLQANTVETHGK